MYLDTGLFDGPVVPAAADIQNSLKSLDFLFPAGEKTPPDFAVVGQIGIAAGIYAIARSLSLRF